MSLDISRIRALCFDVDGTLRDTDDQYVDQFMRWLRPVQFLFAKGDTRKLARRLVMALEAPGVLLYSLPDRLGIDNHLAALVEWTFRAGLTRRSDVFWIVLNTYESLRLLSAV